MKKVFLYAMAMVAIVLAGCSEESQETVYETTTKMWPAFDENTELYGFIDAKGAWAIAPQYSDASLYFSNGYALVQVANGRQAFIDMNGKVQDAASFDAAESFEYGYSRASLSNAYGYMDGNLSWVIQPVYKTISMGPDHIATYSVGNKRGFISTNGEVLMKDGKTMIYAAADVFVDGHCVISDDASSYDKSGAIRVPTYYLIDKNGSATIGDGQYYRLVSLGENRLAAMNKPTLKDYESGDWEQVYILLDLEGKIISQVRYAEIKSFHDGLALVKTTDKTPQYGFINANGDLVISCRYDYAESFCNGYAIVMQDDLYKLINTKGEVVKTLGQYDQFRTNAHNGLILIVKDHSSRTDDKYLYEWTEIETGRVVYSWDVKKGNAPHFAQKR